MKEGKENKEIRVKTVQIKELVNKMKIINNINKIVMPHKIIFK